jgi:AcrR family transcriptional regulator
MTVAADPINPLTEESAPTTRCRIIATAERSFRDIGYQKTTVADIAKTLKMSPANVYRFFESKKAINEAVVARLTREVEILIGEIAQAPGMSAADRLTEMITALHQDCLERCEAFPRMHEMIEAAMTESWEVCLQHVDVIVSAYERVIAEGVRRGEFDVDDTRIAASCVHAAVVRYCHPVLVSQCPNAPVPPLEAMIALLLKGLAPAR